MILKLKEIIFTLYINYIKNKIVNNDSLINTGKIGILYTYEGPDKQAIVDKFISLIKHDNKQVMVACYYKQKDLSKYSLNSNYYNFKHSDLSLLGKVLKVELSSFINTDFDFLYIVDLKISPIVKFLVSKSKARYKMGNFSNHNLSMLNVMVKADNITDYNTLVNTMIHYSSFLK